MAGISVLIGISMLAGCGKSLDADTDTVYVQKNGTVLSVDVETLDKDYYDETELKDYVTDAVSTYTGEHGKSAVKLENLSVKDGTATLKMKYKTPEDYTGFNGIELYEGKVVKALAAGYDFKTDFVSVEDGKVTGTATKEEIYSGDSSYENQGDRSKLIGASSSLYYQYVPVVQAYPSITSYINQ